MDAERIDIIPYCIKPSVVSILWHWRQRKTRLWYWRPKFLGIFSQVCILCFKYNVWPLTDQFGKNIHKKARESTWKYNRETLKTNHIQSVQEQDHIDERFNPTSQSTNFTTNNMNCAVGEMLFGSFYFFMVILLLDTALQVQEIIKNQPVQNGLGWIS